MIELLITITTIKNKLKNGHFGILKIKTSATKERMLNNKEDCIKLNHNNTCKMNPDIY